MKTGYETHFKKMKTNKNKFKIKASLGAQPPSHEKIKVQKKRKKFPTTALIGAIFTLAGGLYGYHNVEDVEKYVAKVDIGVFGLADAEEKKIPANSEKKENPTSAKGQAKEKSVVSNIGLTPEEVALFKSLEERKKQLDAKESELKNLEEELHKQKVELDTRMTKLEEMRTQIANQLQERVQTDGESVDKLVSFFSAMKPQKAAEIVDTLNEDLAVEVFKKMKKKDAAEILNMLKSEKAQRLSEKFTGYRKK